MTTSPEVTKVSSAEFDKDPDRWRAQATPGHIVQVLEPSGATTVIMSDADFAGFQATIELLTDRANAWGLLQAVKEAGPAPE